MIFSRLPGHDGSDEEEHPITPEMKAQMIEGYADIAIKIAGLKFEAVGSFDVGPDQDIIIGACVQYINGGTKDASPYGGPFKSMGAFHLFYIDNTLDLIARGIVHRQRLLYAYLVYLEIRRLIVGHEPLWREPAEFYINHPDTHAGNLLLDGGSITGYIDWEWTCTASKEAAFAAPRWISDTDAYLDGDNAIGEEELMLCGAYEKRGRPDLAECVRNGRVHQRIRDNITNSEITDLDDPDTLDILNAITDACLGARAGTLPKTKDEWISLAMSRHAADPRLLDVVSLDAELKRIRQPVHAGPQNPAPCATPPGESGLLVVV